MKNIIKKEEGITLVALVTTIIILLILSGITIGTLASKKGLINEANQSSEAAQKESIIEKIEADLYSEKTITGKIPDESKLIEIAAKYGIIDEIDQKITIAGEYDIFLNEISGWDNSVNKNKFHANKIVFNGTNYLNTGISLFSEENMDKDFEISFKISKINKKNNDKILFICNPSIKSSVNQLFLSGFYMMNQDGIIYMYFFNTKTPKWKNIVLTNDINDNPISIKIKRVTRWLYVSINGGEEEYIMDYNRMSTPIDNPLVFGAGLDENGNPIDFCDCVLENINVEIFEKGLAIKTANSFKIDGNVKFEGDNYLNTGLKLFSNDNINKNFDISFEISNLENNTNLNTLINCMDESGSPWPGFVVRYSETDKLAFKANTTTSNRIEKKISVSGIEKIQIKKINKKIYYIINNGEQVELIDLTDISKTFDVPLTIGASLNGSLSPQRWFKGTLSNISVKITN